MPNFLNDKVISKDQNWFNASSFKNAISRVRAVKSNKDREKVKIFNLGPVPYNEVIVDEKQELEEFVDVVGFYPNVPAFIQGHPLNMYNNKKKKIV